MCDIAHLHWWTWFVYTQRTNHLLNVCPVTINSQERVLLHQGRTYLTLNMTHHAETGQNLKERRTQVTEPNSDSV